MKRLLIAAAIALSGVTACTPGPTTVEAVSARAVITADATYVAASKFGQTLVEMGKMDKAKYKDLDSRAFIALLAVRSARTGANSANTAAAAANLSLAVAALYGAVQE